MGAVVVVDDVVVEFGGIRSRCPRRWKRRSLGEWKREAEEENKSPCATAVVAAVGGGVVAVAVVGGAIRETEMRSFEEGRISEA